MEDDKFITKKREECKTSEITPTMHALVDQWEKSEKTSEVHERILKPYLYNGHYVSIDLIGSTKKITSTSLENALKGIDASKKIVASYTRAIYGEPTGVWDADNANIVFPENIDVEKVTSQLLAAKRETSRLDFPLGIAVHTGIFTRIDGLMVGPEVENTDELAENHAQANQILLTRKVFEKLVKKQSPLVSLLERKATSHGGYLIRDDGREIHTFSGENSVYPYPYSKEVYEKVIQNQQVEMPNYIKEKYLQRTNVLFFKLFPRAKTPLLQELSDRVTADWLFRQACTEFDDLNSITCDGATGRFICANSEDAFEFSKRMQLILMENGFDSRIGISSGSVLFMNLENGYKRIEGLPLNTAAKLAEDSHGPKNTILLDETVKSGISSQNLRPFRAKLSGIELKGTIYHSKL